ALLREARRQKQLPLVAVPELCVLDPDGDVVRHIKRNEGQSNLSLFFKAHDCLPARMNTGDTRLRIWGSGVRISSGAPITNRASFQKPYFIAATRKPPD